MKLLSADFIGVYLASIEFIKDNGATFIELPESNKQLTNGPFFLFCSKNMKPRWRGEISPGSCDVMEDIVELKFKLTFKLTSDVIQCSPLSLLSARSISSKSSMSATS